MRVDWNVVVAYVFDGNELERKSVFLDGFVGNVLLYCNRQPMMNFRIVYQHQIRFV